MKKTLSLVVIFAMLVPCVFANASITADSTFTAFNSDSDSSLDGWTGYAKNTPGTIDSNNWFTYKATKRLVGNVIAVMPESWQEVGTDAPTGNVFYTDKNFGSEYSFSGQFYNFQNQNYVYFNSAISESNGTVTAKSGYRIKFDRKTYTVELQKGSSSIWTTIDSETTSKWGYTAGSFDITFADGLITADLRPDGSSTVNFEYDASKDDDYSESGYIGLGASAGRFIAGKFNVSYNSEKVFSTPTLNKAYGSLKGYNIIPQGVSCEFGVSVNAKSEADVKKCELYIDNAFNSEMTLNDGVYTATALLSEKGTHTAKAVLTDRNGNQTTLKETTLFVSDFLSSPAVFTDSVNGEISSLAEVEGEVTATIGFNPLSRELSSLIMYAAVYDASGKISSVYSSKYTDIEKNTPINASVEITDVSSADKVMVFMFEDYSKPAPLSGGYTLE